MTILPCKPDSVVSSTAEMKDLSVTTLRTGEVSAEIKQLLIIVIKHTQKNNSSRIIRYNNVHASNKNQLLM